MTADCKWGLVGAIGIDIGIDIGIGNWQLAIGMHWHADCRRTRVPRLTLPQASVFLTANATREGKRRKMKRMNKANKANRRNRTDKRTRTRPTTPAHTVLTGL